MLDFRFNTVKLGERSNLYVEIAPFLSRRAFYEFIVFDYRTVGKLRFGVESENVHRPGRDSLDVGPRASYPLFSFKNGNVVLAYAYQFHRQEPNISRLYVVTNIRLGKK